MEKEATQHMEQEYQDAQKLKDVNKYLVDMIAARTHLDRSQIENLDIEEVERELNIKTAVPKIYSGWGRGEKVGWQVSPYNFVSKKDLDKRERRLGSILSGKGY
ncbi:MAG: hypothetical protein J7J06_03015 [Methanosarcinales archaeon]|nr:hypothetical protein [Methanosarcinales archaeon]